MTYKEMTSKLHEFTCELMSAPPTDPRAATLQSVIGMVHTLNLKGQITDLSKVLHLHYAAYYTEAPPLLNHSQAQQN